MVSLFPRQRKGPATPTDRYDLALKSFLESNSSCRVGSLCPLTTMREFVYYVLCTIVSRRRPPGPLPPSPLVRPSLMEISVSSSSVCLCAVDVGYYYSRRDYTFPHVDEGARPCRERVN